MPTRFIELAGEINSSMPQFVIDRTTDALNSLSKSVRGAKIGILGIAYKKDIDDPRESPSFKIMELLEARGAILSYSDPHIPQIPSMRSFQVPQLSSEPLTAEYLESLDCVIIATDHTAFDYRLILDKSKLVVDTRNASIHAAKSVAGAIEKIWKA
jgi:UDP-N-acetyl-D-glucosamine dehydrogenase